MMERPIRTDGSNPFARHTMVERIPGILEEVRRRNPGLPESARDALGFLAGELRGNVPIPPPETPMPDYEYWLSEWRRRNGDTWLDTEWFYAEHWAYRLLAGITGWWVTGLDPFGENKREEYEGDRFGRLLAGTTECVGRALASGGGGSAGLEEALAAVLLANLWGNRADLSHTVSMSFGEGEDGDANLLADDREQVARLVLEGGDRAGGKGRRDGPRDAVRRRGAVRGGSGARDTIQIVTDNAGSELAMDLVLSDLILSSDPELTGIRRVVLHTKLHPTYVSDATAADVLSCIEWIGRRGREDLRDDRLIAVAGRLSDACRSGRLVIAPDLFWNSASFLGRVHGRGSLPARIGIMFAGAKLVVLKGDVNYRRLEGDIVLPPEASGVPAASIVPAPVLVIRAIKSDPLSGVDAARVRELDGTAPGWRATGRYGMIRLDR